MRVQLRGHGDRSSRSAPRPQPVVSVRRRRLYATVEVDCYRSGPIADASCAALARHMVAWACAPAREWASIELGPESYGTTRAPLDRASVLARVLVDLWRGNPDEALIVLAGSSAADRDRIRHLAAQSEGWCMTRGGHK